MKKTRLTAMALALLTALTLTGGPALAESTEAAEAKTVTGRVTQVSATAITVELGTYTAPAAPGKGADASSSATVKPEANAPEATVAPEATAAPDAAPDAATDAAEAQTAAPDASAPQGDQSASSGFTASGESLTFILTDSTVITVGGRNQKGSVADIAVGSILTVQLSGDAATSITVFQAGFGRGFGQDNPRGFDKGSGNDRNRGGKGSGSRRGNPGQGGAPTPDSGAANPGQSAPDNAQNMPGT